MYVRIMGTLPYGILFLAASAASTIDIIVILAAHIHKKIRWSKHPGKTSLSPNIIISSGSFWPLVRLLSSVRYSYKGEQMDRYRDRTDTIRTVLIHLENVQRCTTQSCCTLASIWLIRAVASEATRWRQAAQQPTFWRLRGWVRPLSDAIQFNRAGSE